MSPLKRAGLAILFLCLGRAMYVRALSPDAVSTNSPWVDVSQGLGVPIGGLGTGYSVFGKFGFVHVNFNGQPDHVKYDPRTRWGTTYTQEPAVKATFGFVLEQGNTRYALQSTPATWDPSATPVEDNQCFSYLPKGRVLFNVPQLGVKVNVTAYAPLLPHDLATATIPVQIYDITLRNDSLKTKHLKLRLENIVAGQASGNIVVFADREGQLAFGVQHGSADKRGVSGTLDIPAHDSRSMRFVIGWYYPSLPIRDHEKRYYTKAFHNAPEVVVRGLEDADSWSRRIDAWHDSLEVPAYFKRMWFSSLSSVMTSSMLTDEPAYYAIETPHDGFNTMDVDAYTSWSNLINWPELERMDMEEFFATTALSGPDAGAVLHSLPNDRSDYAVEPIFIVRLYRDYLWFNDRSWAAKGFPLAVQAANHVYNRGHYEFLIDSPKGNQSYDAWKMPGVSAYVNSPWVYGLYGLERLSQTLHTPALVAGMPISDLALQASRSFDSVLWNDRLDDWNCFFRTRGASLANTPDETFTDQLFGRWMLAIDPEAKTVLPSDKVVAALHTLYTNNLVDDPQQSFRGWVNGMLPDHKPDMHAGYHSRTFWFGPQINLGSLLGLTGDDNSSLDVFRSVEESMHGNDLAAGEWNQSVDAAGQVTPLPEEPGKDTPRFPPYPRYQSSWEYLPRLIGLQMDEHYLYVKPYHAIGFSLDSIELAGTALTVHVEAGWNRALMDGKPVSLPVRIPRETKTCRLKFLR